ncbi:MAG: CHAT domain-containing protein [Cyanobacteria bacterium P01_G01_bin.19]
MFRKYYIFGLIALLVCLWWGNIVTAQPETNALVRQGVELYQNGRVKAAIASWQTALDKYDSEERSNAKAIIVENLARAYQQLGKNDRALDYWQQAIALYQQLGNKKQLERSLTEQAQTYARLGQHQQAIAILCGVDTDECSPDSAISIARQQQDKLGEASALGSLGETYRLRGDYQPALDYLKHSLNLAARANLTQLEISALNSLGNTYSSLAQVDYRRAISAKKRGEDFGSNNLTTQLKTKGSDKDRTALEYLSASLQLAEKQGDRTAQLKVIINSLPIYYRVEDSKMAAQRLKQALFLLSEIPTTTDKVYATINLAKLLQPKSASPNTCYGSSIRSQAKELLEQAATQAKTLGDFRSLSFAKGELGHWYECDRDYQQALQLTQNARWLAEQELQSKDSLYLWEWQTGRIFRQQRNLTAAINLYQRAIATLDSIRQDILTANRDIQFDFRDTVEPIYREAIALMLEQIPTDKPIAAANENLNLVLEVFDSLQLAELQNYFGNDCAIKEVERDAEINQNDAVAIFHSIMLPQKTALVASFPNGDRTLVWLDRDRETLRTEIVAFNEGLVRWYDNQYNPKIAKTLYDLMLAPFASDLERRKIDTLVFVQDGILRNVPMSALYDGKQYLIEKYAIAITPSLSVTESTSKKRSNHRVLALGLTDGSTIDGLVYPPLPQVRREINQIEREFENSKLLLNEQFTRDRFGQELALENYSIVHIASHGKFGTEPQDTFLIAGNNKTIGIEELDRLLRNASQESEPIELLSLTACETALGDERATLSLAGVAVRAGVKSAIASLWSLDDSITPQLVQQFYANLQDPAIGKAKALQKAQLSLIEQNLHPAYWASFIAIGNWL